MGEYMQYTVAPTQEQLDPVYQFEGDADIWRDWCKVVALVKHLTWRHLASRYRSSALGFVWSLLNPVLLMGVYTFIFSIILRTTIPGIPYAVFFLTGVLAWNFVSIASMNAAVSLVDGASLINKAAFPRIALPLSAVLSNAINYLMALPLLVLFNWLFGIAPRFSLLLLPGALLLLLLMATGVGLLLAGLMPFFRDLQHLIEALFTMWFFLTPVIYPMVLVQQNLPEALLPVYELNPMVGTVHFVHTIFLGQPLPGRSIVVAVGGGLCLFSLGFWVFQSLAARVSEL
jgi:ABC-type polysaccharide/polyol phosphate export permease